MVADLGANRLYRAPGESSHQWVSMDFVSGITAWGVSGSCRHLTPGKESLGLGSRQILPAARSRSGPPARSGGGLEDENGRVSGSPPQRDTLLRICLFISSQRAQLLEVCVYFSIVCWLEPEVGVAPGQTGLLWCAAARFPLAGLQHSRVDFVGRV